jgi:hypothetical protein
VALPQPCTVCGQEAVDAVDLSRGTLYVCDDCLADLWYAFQVVEEKAAPDAGETAPQRPVREGEGNGRIAPGDGAGDTVPPAAPSRIEPDRRQVSAAAARVLPRWVQGALAMVGWWATDRPRDLRTALTRMAWVNAWIGFVMGQAVPRRWPAAAQASIPTVLGQVIRADPVLARLWAVGTADPEAMETEGEVTHE